MRRCAGARRTSDSTLLLGAIARIGPWLSDVARAADDAGFDSGYSSLGFLAATTRRVRVGLLVTGVMYRDPGLLVKTVTTIDVLSGGRAILGIGAAWYEEGARGLGLPFPNLPHAFGVQEVERLAKVVAVAASF